MYSVLLAGLKGEENFAFSHFSSLGYQVVTAKDVVEAKEKLPDSVFNLVFLRPSSESAAVDELRRLTGASTDLAVVLVLAQPATELVLECWHAGAADILIAPLTAVSLDASLQQCGKRFLLDEVDTSEQARIAYFDDSGRECSANIIPPRFTIGRSSTNNLVLGHMGISRSHAEILFREGKYLLRDLGSKLGTYLNGARIEESPLSNGDRIQLGGPQGMCLIFHGGDLLQSLLGHTGKSDISISVRGFKEIGMLLATFRALSSISLLDDLLALVVDTAIQLTGAERGFIMLKEENDTLSFRCARNSYKRPLDGSSFQTSRRTPYEVFKTGRRMVISDLDLGDISEDHAATRRLGLRSISCVPLSYLAFHDPGGNSAIQHVETIGVLYVDSQQIGAGLSTTHIDALETLASEAAMAIYNARLYKDSQEKRRIEEQLAIARELQQSLLPQPNRELPYVRACSQNLPCHEVGGDYFDYFDLDEGRFCFVIGDVAGKGISAALLASVVQGIFSTQTFRDSPLDTIVFNLNRNLTKRGTGNRFVTSFFGILDAQGNCTYVNAGHNPPILLRRNGTIQKLTEGGMVLGLFAAAQYRCETVKLNPGDHLVLFTDGVVEALNTAGEEFGEERLCALLGADAQLLAPDILARLRDAVLSFSTNAPQHDDITIMALGFCESAVPSGAAR